MILFMYVKKRKSYSVKSHYWILKDLIILYGDFEFIRSFYTIWILFISTWGNNRLGTEFSLFPFPAHFLFQLL